MKFLQILALFALTIAPASADDEETAEKAAVAETDSSNHNSDNVRNETGAERNIRKDLELARAADAYNEAVEVDLDKVVCKKIQITGSRRKQRVCKTVREIEAEKASTNELFRRLKRSGVGAEQTTGQGQ